MKTKILRYGECEPGDQKLAGKITLEAETREEQELLDFMHGMNQKGGLVPTVDILLEMISNGMLVRRGDEWALKADVLLSTCQSEMMYG